MPYEEYVWKNKGEGEDTPLNKTHLNHLEAGIKGEEERALTAEAEKADLEDGVLKADQVPGSVAKTDPSQGVVYVTIGGDDSNDGRSWGSAKATIQAAIDALPVIAPNTGGTVEVGHGDFTITEPITILLADEQQGVTVRGRGIGHERSYNAETTKESYHPTRIINNGTGDAIHILGVENSTIESEQLYGTRIEDIAVIGSSTTGNGVVIEDAPRTTLCRVACEAHGKWGCLASNSYWLRFEQLYCIKNGVEAGNENTGGLRLGASAVANAVLVVDSILNGNFGVGVSLAGESATFINTDMSRNKKKSESHGFGAIVKGELSANFLGCFFEANDETQLVNSGGAPVSVIGCLFTGDSASRFGIASYAGPTNIVGCRFEGHLKESVESYPNPTLYAVGNSSTDPYFTKTYESGGVVIPATAAYGVVNFGAQSAARVIAHKLTVAGAMTINANEGDGHEILLSAEASSSSISGGAPGQRLTIEWVQDATGSRVYEWPANCKFAGGAAPASSIGAGYRDSVTFRYDGTNWYETSRAVGVH